MTDDERFQTLPGGVRINLSKFDSLRVLPGDEVGLTALIVCTTSCVDLAMLLEKINQVAPPDAIDCIRRADSSCQKAYVHFKSLKMLNATVACATTKNPNSQLCEQTFTKQEDDEIKTIQTQSLSPPSIKVYSVVNKDTTFWAYVFTSLPLESPEKARERLLKCFLGSLSMEGDAAVSYHVHCYLGQTGYPSGCYNATATIVASGCRRQILNSFWYPKNTRTIVTTYGPYYLYSAARKELEGLITYPTHIKKNSVFRV